MSSSSCPPSTLTDWALGWLLTAAKIAGNDAICKRVEAEQKKRLRHTKSTPDRDDILRPAVRGDGPPPADGSGTAAKPKPRKKPGGKQGA